MGPVSFFDLVYQARQWELDLEDAVRADHDEEWRPAGEVAGLFHMAGRADEVSRWRAERREKRSGDRSQETQQSHRVGSGVATGFAESVPTQIAPSQSEDSPRIVTSGSTVNEPNESNLKADPHLLTEVPSHDPVDPGELGPSDLSREIKTLIYAAAVQLRDRYGHPVEAVPAQREPSRLRELVGQFAAAAGRSLRFLVSIPFVLLVALWSRIVGNSTLPRWVEESLSVLFSRDMLITAFRWGMTLAIPNLVAFGILSWSNVEAQRYPLHDKTQLQPKVFPVWGKCSSEGEYTFLLIDTMLAAGIGTYLGIRWLEAMAEDE